MLPSRSTSPFRLSVLFSALAFALAAPAAMWGKVIAGPDPQPVPPSLAGELERLAAKAPEVDILAARYRLRSTSIVEGVESSFTQEGRVFYDQGDLAVYRELTPAVDDMQLLYQKGELRRYFPVAGYGHRVIDGSLDKERTDFARFWRPWLAHFKPVGTIKATVGSGQVQQTGSSGTKLIFEPDHASELGSRPASDLLEYWGPRPDVTFVTSDQGRVEAVERALYQVSKTATTSHAVVWARSVTVLDSRIAFSGVLIPTRLTYEVTIEGQTSPYRTSTLELIDVVVGQEPPASAFAPVWPADAFLLDVEPREPSVYWPTRDEPASQIRLADAYFGHDQRTEAETWIDTFLSGFADRGPTPSEAGQAGRLLSLVGRQDEARKMHLGAIRTERKHVAAGGPESELVRYLGEYAYFMAYHVGRRMHDEAGRFLEGKLGELKTTMAIAELAGRASHHYALDRKYTLALDVLTLALERVGDSQQAQALLDACRARLEIRQSQNTLSQQVAAKRKKIRDLETRLREFETLKLRTPGSVAEKARLEEELAELETKP